MVTTSKTMELKSVENDNVLREPTSQEDLFLKKRRARDFVQEIKSEFSQITWTNIEDLKNYTKIVVGSTFVLGLGVYFVDLAIQTVLNTLTWITRITLG